MLRANIANKQLEYLDKPERVERILAIVPHGAGQRFILEHKAFAEELTTYLKSIRFGEEGAEANEALEVFTPVAAHSMDRARKFSAPWTYFLEIPADDALLRPFLLWQEVFAIHPTMSFSVHDPTDTSPLWKVLVLSGTPGAVNGNPNHVKEILANIKSAMWTNGRFCNLVADCVEKYWGHTGDYASRVKAASDTMDLLLTRGEAHGTEQPTACYVLLAKPISPDREEMKEFKSYLTAPGIYWRGPYALEINRASVDCKLCKDVTHCMLDCPLPQTPGWQGTPPSTISTSSAQAAPTLSMTLDEQARNIWKDVPRRGDNSGRGRSRSGRGPRRGSSASRGRP
ncbi:hypothetical protein BD311DRAFT_670758 [Dichomitus squalens]|uniref:Uncharacterized protein n=1 Tax=Dichomitus squalens TaxID=114155 RepID=A0A4Q9MGF1_9APHY|nr:hypothetical protein BD311DRAFT_670758 [Dichomitus squalens]